jgi:hypothetical protein
MLGTLRDLLGFINIRAIHILKEARDIALAIGERNRKELPQLFKGID